MIESIDKVFAGILVLASIASVTILAVVKVPVPDYATVMYGFVFGYATHTFGVVSGVAAAVVTIKNGVVNTGGGKNVP